MIDFHDYLGSKVKITDKDGLVVEGLAISYDVGLEDDLDYDSIGVEPIGKDYIIVFPIPDIVSVEVMKE